MDFKSLEMNKLKFEMLSLLTSSRNQFELSAELVFTKELELENEYSQETLALYANAQLKL